MLWIQRNWIFVEIDELDFISQNLLIFVVFYWKPYSSQGGTSRERERKKGGDCHHNYRIEAVEDHMNCIASLKY